MGAGFGDIFDHLRAAHGFQLAHFSFKAGLSSGSEVNFFQGLNSGSRPFVGALTMIIMGGGGNRQGVDKIISLNLRTFSHSRHIEDNPIR